MRRKKKINFVVVLLVVALMVLGACGSETEEVSTAQDNNQAVDNSQEQQEEPLYAEGEDGIIYLSYEYCMEHMITAEITTENWEEYFEFAETSIGKLDDYGTLTYITKHELIPYTDGRYLYGFVNPNNPDAKGAFSFVLKGDPWEYANQLKEELNDEFWNKFYADESKKFIVFGKELARENAMMQIELMSRSGEFNPSINSGECCALKEEGNIYEIETVPMTKDMVELEKVSAIAYIIPIPDELWKTNETGISVIGIGKPYTSSMVFKQPTFQDREKIPSWLIEKIQEQQK